MIALCDFFYPFRERCSSRSCGLRQRTRPCDINCLFCVGGCTAGLFGASLCRLLCWFLDAGKKEAPQAQLTGVQKAPRHEVAGSWAPAKQRAL
jgi:hypothetical protein